MAEVVTHGETGYLFKTGDSRDMATALKEILKNPQRLPGTAKKGRQLMENNYGWDKLDTVQGVRNAAQTHAKRYNLDPIPKRQHI